MYRCPSCQQNTIALWRRLLTPERVRCPACGAVSRGQPSPRLAIIYAIGVTPVAAFALAAARREHHALFVVAGILVFAALLASQLHGPLRTRHSPSSAQAAKASKAFTLLSIPIAARLFAWFIALGVGIWAWFYAIRLLAGAMQNAL